VLKAHLFLFSFVRNNGTSVEDLKISKPGGISKHTEEHRYKERALGKERGKRESLKYIEKNINSKREP
jgi:hypothetical protein